MNGTNVKRVVIAGGGTAGWVAATALSKKLGDLLDITLIESELIGTVGVGEATIPPMRKFHELMGIPEREFVQATNATFKLGIAFRNWGLEGDDYLHSFGMTGKSSWMADFHHFWRRGLEKGIDTEIGEFCVEHKAARAGRFAITREPAINYAYHLDATLYAKFLRKICEQLGVRRIEGKIGEVLCDNDTGYIKTLCLEDGQRIDGDLFLDCTGFRGLLIEQTLKTGYEDWNHWLPCDSAIAVQTESKGPIMPYTESVAYKSGWRWRIPLQSRVGNGMVYCSQYISDDEAHALLLSEVDGERRTDPRLIKFRTGRRNKTWSKNCIALGLASGFLEPLESTSIHLVVIGVTRLLQHFPFNGVRQSVVDHYNKLTNDDLENIRDFLILHYHATQRNDSEFWRYCREMDVPESLVRRIDMFESEGLLVHAEGELFAIDSWIQVMLGQRLEPRHYHPLPRLMNDDELKQFLGSIRASVANSVAQLPRHEEFINRYCKSSMS